MQSIKILNGKIQKVNDKILKFNTFAPNVGLKFDGINDYVNIPFNETLNFEHSDSFSFSFIFRNDFTTFNATYGEQIFAHTVPGVGTGYYVIVSNDTISLVIRGGLNNYRRLLFTFPHSIYNKNTHIVILNDSSNVYNQKCYFNGVEIVGTFLSDDVITTIKHTNSYTMAKFNIYSEASYNKANIYHTQIYNKAISQEEAKSLYNSANKSIPSSAQPNLVANWNFEEKQGTTLNDYSGNNYNGTLMNFGTTSNLGGGAWIDANGNIAT